MDLKSTFAGTMPENYDRYLGPAWFDPLAQDLAARLPQRPPGDVLEIACGTGIVTARLRERLDPAVRVVATDISESMLDYAHAKLRGRAGIEWRKADALRLPFRDGEFAAVACAFGVMYFPDKAAGLREIHRVLGPGGLLAFNVFDRKEANPCGKTCAALFEELFPGDGDAQFNTPYELADVERLRALLAEARFDPVRIEVKRVPIEGLSARDVATGQIRGSPRVTLLEQRGVSVEDVIDKLAARLARLGGLNPFTNFAQAIVVEARAASRAS